MRYIETVEVPVGEPEDYPKNARIHDDAWLDESAETNGQYRSIVARRLDDGRLQLLAGHGTRAAFRRKGSPTVRVEVIEADDTEARRINLVDNPRPGIGGFDDKLLLELLDEASKDGGLGGTGWDGEAYKELLDAADEGNPFDHDPNGDADNFDEEPPEEPVTQPGDVWVLGPHRLVCGDSTTDEAWAALLPDGELADLAWTDPPYNVAVTGGTHDPRDKKNHGKGPVIANDSMSDADFAGFLQRVFDALIKRLRPGGAIYVCHADTEGINFRTTFRDAGFFLHEVLIWVKQEFVFGRSDYHWQHEPILYGWRPGAAHQFLGPRNQSTTWMVDRPMRSAMEHPTQKPVDLPKKAIENSAAPGELVVDPFGGGGSTMVAAHLLSRPSRLIELDPAYCDVIARRYQDLTGDLPVLERTGERFDFHGADGPVAVAA